MKLKILQQTRTTHLLALTLVLLPLYVIRFTIAGIPTTVLEMLIGITTVSWLFDLPNIRNLFIQIKTYIVQLSLILLGATISLLFSQDIVSAFGTYRAYIIEPLILFFVTVTVLKLNSDSEKRNSTMQYLWSAILLLATWLAALGVLQYVFDVAIITDHQADRAHAVFNNANALAMILIPILIVHIRNMYREYESKKMSTLSILIFILLLIASIMTHSLGGLLALGLGVTTLILLKIFTQFRKTSLLRFIMLLIMFSSFLFMLNISYFTYETDNPWVRTGSTLDVRFCVWEGTIELLKDNMLTGGGHRSFQELYSSSYVTCDAEPLVYPHNIFLNFWVDIGIIGLLGMLLLFWKVFTVPNRYSFFFLMILIHGLVDVPFFKNDLAILFFVMLGLVVSDINVNVINTEDD